MGQIGHVDTLHWYCDGPEPTLAAHRYNNQVRQRKSVANTWFWFFNLSLSS